MTDGSTNLAGAAIVVAGHDHVCASVGVGAIGDDGLVDSMGTGEALVRAIAAKPSRPGAGRPGR